MICTRMVRVKRDGLTFYYPCRSRCLACRQTRALSNSIKCLFALREFGYSAIFITLTYDNEHLPVDGSLNREDLKLFWKRLRKRLGKRKIKYFACGEYGSVSRTERPHYHAIVFGLDYNDDNRNLIKKSWSLCSSTLFDGDNKGFCPATPSDIAYVCGYVQKKLYDTNKKYEDDGLLPPFVVQSTKLGLSVVLNDPLLRDGTLNYRGRVINLPRYYRDKLNIEPDKRQFIDAQVQQMHSYFASIGYDDTDVHDYYQLVKLFYEHQFESFEAINDINEHKQKIKALRSKI